MVNNVKILEEIRTCIVNTSVCSVNSKYRQLFFPQSAEVVEYPSSASMQVAPITGENAGVKRSEVKQGVREVLLCKDQDGKMGLRVRAISKVNYSHTTSHEIGYIFFYQPICNQHAQHGVGDGDMLLDIYKLLTC